MDWKNAKSILIFVFLILNIVLAVALYNEVKMDEIPQQTISNTSNILGQNNIHIECPIPKYTGNDYTLKYEEMPLDRNRIAGELLGKDYVKESNNIYKKDAKSLIFYDESGFLFLNSANDNKIKSDFKSSIDKYLKDSFDKMGLPFNEFKQDGYYPDVTNENNVRITYKGQYKDYFVFDNFIDVQVSDLKIKSIKFRYKKPASIMKKKDVFVIPSHEILITEMTKYPGISITQVDMGFKGYTKSDNSTKTSFEGLSWRIKTYDGKEYFFNARNGTLIE